MKRKPALDDYVDAILDRDKGMPYAKVLEKYEIKPNQFYYAIMHKLKGNPLLREGLGEILNNPERRKELFNMGEEFVKMQYDRIMGRIPGETQKRFFQGTYLHSANVNAIIYHALVSDKPELASKDRPVVTGAVKSLPSDLFNYLRELGLNGLMLDAFEKGKRGSPLAVLEVFDRVYQKITGDASLFDPKQECHLKFDLRARLVK